MKERPILFSGPMIRALLDGTKTQTRRVVKPQPRPGTKLVGIPEGWTEDPAAPDSDGNVTGWRCPYGQPGDRLWVRETFNGDPSRGIGYAYRATQPEMDGCPWVPSIHMPRAASRITLEITAVRVERLNKITKEDALSEGIERRPCDCAHDGMLREVCPHSEYKTHFKDYADKENLSVVTPGYSFLSLWESINGPGSYHANPWVWVVEFKRVMP